MSLTYHETSCLIEERFLILLKVFSLEIVCGSALASARHICEEQITDMTE